MKYAYLFLTLIFFTACSKDILDRKPDKSLVIPSTLDDFEALLNNTSVLTAEQKVITEFGTTDYYLAGPVWQSLSNVTERNAFVWNSDVYEGAGSVVAWDATYKQVLYANLVLDGLKDFSPAAGEVNRFNEIKATALFYRSNAFLNALMIFTEAYDSENAINQKGIPLRLDADFNKPSTRANLESSYQQVLNDLEMAAPLLPDTRSHKTLPSAESAYALLARTCLLMGNYERALKNAEEALTRHDALLDYNNIDSAAQYPFTDMNMEVLFRSSLSNYTSFRAPNSKIDSLLIKSYHEHDLRKALFFLKNADGSMSFRGSYIGSILLFGGIATDELYLIRSECLARLGDWEVAMNVLNKLLMTRYRRGFFTPAIATGDEQALTLILRERRKELLLRGIRWSDLKRLNKEDRFKVTLRRELNGNVYELPPNDPRYVYPIPDYIIAVTGMEQNR